MECRERRGRLGHAVPSAGKGKVGVMIAIDEGYVESAAPNPEAMKNGRGLVAKGKFLALHIDADETILFGQCQGSGKEPYHCSSDFARPEQPTHRCSCPSRQFPCKHCVGL